MFKGKYFTERVDHLRKSIDACEIQLAICRALYRDRVETGNDTYAIECEMALIMATIRDYTDELHDLQH